MSCFISEVKYALIFRLTYCISYSSTTKREKAGLNIAMLGDLSVGQNKCLAQVSISENIADDTNTDTDRSEGNVRFFL